MFENYKILGLIPARGGSKGLPRKNIKNLGGKPLVAWSIEQAKQSKYLDTLVVSTDDEEIARISGEYGAEVPFMRPKEFARDDSPTSDVILHAVDFFEKNHQRFDYICLLEPTSPLRKRDDIDRGIRLLAENRGADALVTVGEVHTEHPLIIKKIMNNRVVPYIENARSIYQRQQADKAYFPYGVVYLSTVESFKKTRTFYTPGTIPMRIERWQNYEIDDEIDFRLTELLIEKFMDKIKGE